MEKLTVHLLRGGAPDKIALAHSPYYKLVKHDNTNIVGMSLEDLCKYTEGNNYILPADEMDIKAVNEVNGNPDVDQSHILLPQDLLGNVINYDKFVPKDSNFYRSLANPKGNLPIYPQTTRMSISQFIEWSNDPDNACKLVAIKTATGSGSRGVKLVDESCLNYGGKYIPKLTKSDVNDIVEFAASQNNCDILIQELIPFRQLGLKKVNVDIVMKHGNMLGYKWDEVDQHSLFTNWDQGYFRDNCYIKELMNNFEYHLRNHGVCHGLLNFEAFSNMKDTTYLVEVNWRYSNSTFEWMAAGIDPIMCLLFSHPCSIPDECLDRQFKRYWQCQFTDELLEQV